MSVTLSSYPASPGQDYPVSEAVISEDGLYRYVLNRRWDAGPVMPWIMLNPSTADASVNDPTIVRCMKLARREGCGGICVLNLYALRSPDPAALRDARWRGDPDPVGPENDKWLAGLGELAELALPVEGDNLIPLAVAWGAHPLASDRVTRVLELIAPMPVVCLGVTAGGPPKHPLARGRHRIPDGQPFIPWPVS